MFILALLAACGGSEEAALRGEVARLETEVATLHAEINGLRRTQANLEMLEAASAAQAEAIQGHCSEEDGVFWLEPDLIARIQDSPESLMREGRWIPSTRNDYTAWRAVHIRRGSLLASCGIRNGDVLTQVNSERSPSEWKGTLSNAMTVQEAVVEILRGTQPMEITYRVR